MRTFLLLIGLSSLAFGQLFSDDAERAVMENYVSNGWTLNNSAITYATNPVHSGQYSYSSTPTGSVDASAYQSYASNDPAYLKFWFYVPSSYTLGSGSTTRIGGLAQVPGSFATYAVSVTNSGGTLFLQASSTNGTHAVSANNWHSMEMEYAQSSGVVTIWLDGTQDIALTGLTLETKNNVLIGANSGTGTIYYDDITVGTTASGSPTCNLSVRHPYPTNRIAMLIQSYLWGASPSDSLIASIDGTPFSTITNPGTYQAPLLILSSLSSGSHTLLVQLKTSGGTVRASSSETITAFGGTPSVALDQYGNFIQGVHKLFPITGWFPNGSTSVTSWQSAGYVSDAGWASPFAGTYNSTQYQSYLTATGLPTIGPGSGRVNSDACAVSATCAAAFGTYASTFTSNPGILAWFAFDEASTNGWSVAQMQAVQSAVHANDSNHALLYDDASVVALNLSWYSPNAVADVYSSDNYPLCYHNTYISEGKNFASWVSMMDRDARANFGTIPNLIVLELYKFFASPSGFDCTSVTATTVYNEAWLSVIHGRQGVAWYDNGSENSSGYGPACANDSATSCFPANPTTHIGKFVSDIATITPDNVLANPSALSVASNQTTPGSRVDVAVRQGPTGATWVFGARLTDIIANPAEATFPPLSTTITVTGLGSGYMNVLNESRTVPVFSGVFTDNFSPYGVHLYQFISGSVLSGPTTISGPVVIR